MLELSGGGGGGGTGGHSGWDRKTWARKKDFESAIEASLKATLTPEDQVEVAKEILGSQATPEQIAKVARTLAPKPSSPVRLRSQPVVEDDSEDEEVSIQLLLEADYEPLKAVLPSISLFLKGLL